MPTAEGQLNIPLQKEKSILFFTEENYSRLSNK